MALPRLARVSAPVSPLPGEATPATHPSIPRTPAAGSNRPVGELLTPAEAAARLSVTAKVLECWRGSGQGPAYVKLTSKTIRYRPGDLDAFIADRTRTSTVAA